YCTNTPCIVCAKMLINAGVKEIIFSGDYPDDLAKQMLDDSKIKLRKLKNKNNKTILLEENNCFLKK
ncbi:MAG: hypothetical protein KAJ21_03530, partial [Thermoplasmatales archaeon]|nr:hypothetical protein [Thermoplasmatales archaeon]